MKTRKQVQIFLAIVILFSSIRLYAQEINYKIAAIYLYSFTKYIAWPSKKADDKFVIAVYESSPIIEELKNLTLNKTVNGLPIEIKVINQESELAKCNMLYLPFDKGHQFENFARLSAKNDFLLVTQGKDFAKLGAGINLVMLNGKQKFEVNERLINKAGLKVRSELLPLAIKIK
jgi:hypothetical protein